MQVPQEECPERPFSEQRSFVGGLIIKKKAFDG
jgi:hypothetical protein